MPTQPGQKTFEKDYADAAKSLQASPHCLAYELSQCKEDPAHYVLRLEWDSEEGHLNGFRTSPAPLCSLMSKT